MAGADHSDQTTDARRTTLKRSRVPYVVAVGLPARVTACCRFAGAMAASALVEETDIAGLATCAAQYRPLAIVLIRDVYEFDPSEFDALARDVAAVVVPVTEDEPDEALKQRMVGEIERAQRLRAELA